MTDDRSVLEGEESIIGEFLAPLAAGFPGSLGLEDDCALIAPAPGHELVLKTDPVAAGVHFHRDDAPEDIAWKALAVNVSDLAAKAAVPRAYLMALSFPAAPTRDWMRRFAAGLAEAQAAFGLHLMGGDTDRRPGPLSVSITVFGEVPAGRMVRRATARPGDRLYVSGDLGLSALGLALRLDAQLGDRLALDATARAAAERRYLRPTPRLGLRAALRAHAGAAMDLSDGLAKDLGRMCKASACGARVHRAQLPLSPAVRQAIAADPGLASLAYASGDDYEVLAAVPPAQAAAFEAAAACEGVPVTAVGDVTAGGGVTVLDEAGAAVPLARTGWDHF